MCVYTQDSPKIMLCCRGCWRTFSKQPIFQKVNDLPQTTQPIQLVTEADACPDDTVQSDRNLFVGLCILKWFKESGFKPTTITGVCCRQVGCLGYGKQ